jgi:ribonuclease J
MRAKIHRGSHEIGGSCVELEADDGHRIVLDLGRPLNAGWDEQVELPQVAGLRSPDPALLGLIISHPHLDHYGLATDLEVDVPIYLGEEAARLLEAAAFFSPITAALRCTGHLRHREGFTLGPFTTTPYLADHSGFDAYSLLIEADGQRLFYTGDLRAHGRKRSLFEQLIVDPPTAIDVLLMEGTHVRAEAGHDEDLPETETELEERFVATCATTKGAVVAFGSAQNLDRLVTVYRAAKRSGRTLVVDLYGATVAAATRSSIPQPGFDALKVYVPNRQRIRVKESGEFDRAAAIREHRLFPEALAAEPSRYLLYVPSSTAGELLRAEVLTPAGLAVWSMWDGYLTEPSGKRLTTMLADAGVDLRHLHTSGHASVPALRRLVDALAPQRVVPIHSEGGDRYADLFPRVDQQLDGAWWDVARV